MTCPHCGAALAADARFCGACGRATSATEPSYAGHAPPGAGSADLVGREIAGRYRVIAKLGEGGMGAVYRGEQISLKRKVAIKVLRPELSADPGLVRRFNSEAELVAKLSHPNTVNIYDFGQDPGGALFIAMEFLEGRSLRQLTQEGPLPPVRALAIARQIAASLADAHAHGIVHRDLKPDNVMLTERGKERDVVRVLDFGIAKLRDDNRATVNAMTQAGDLVGTPQYMAPEQIRGETVDGRTDVYALGAILYEMTTGRLPFEGTTVMAILSKHLTEAPPPPTARRPDLALPPALDALIMAALAKDPGVRPPSMERFAEEMQALEAQLGGPTASAGYPVPSGPMGVAQPILSPAPGASAYAMPTPAPPAYAPPSAPPSGYPPPAAAASGYAMPQAAPAPPPFGRPPGVPRSYPPGVLPPQPPVPGPPYAPPFRAAPPARSLLWLWILLGVLGAAAVGVAVVVGVLAEKRKQEEAKRADDPPVNDWNSGPSPASWYRHDEPSLGWSIELPPDLPRDPIIAEDGTRSFMKADNGQIGLVTIGSVPKIGDIDDDNYDDAARRVMSTFNATISERGWIDTAGESRYHAVGTVSGQTIEVRFYESDDRITVVVYSRGGSWSDRAGERERVFGSLQLGGGS